MTLYPISLVLSLTLTACEGDKGFQEFNYPPEVRITSHQSGVSLYEGDTITFEAALSDLNDDAADLNDPSNALDDASPVHPLVRGHPDTGDESIYVMERVK